MHTKTAPKDACPPLPYCTSVPPIAILPPLLPSPPPKWQHLNKKQGRQVTPPPPLPSPSYRRFGTARHDGTPSSLCSAAHAISDNSITAPAFRPAPYAALPPAPRDSARPRPYRANSLPPSSERTRTQADAARTGLTRTSLWLIPPFVQDAIALVRAVLVAVNHRLGYPVCQSGGKPAVRLV